MVIQGEKYISVCSRYDFFN